MNEFHRRNQTLRHELCQMRKEMEQRDTLVSTWRRSCLGWKQQSSTLGVSLEKQAHRLAPAARQHHSPVSPVLHRLAPAAKQHHRPALHRLAPNPGSPTSQSSTAWAQQPGSSTGQPSTDWPQQPGSTTAQSPQSSTDWPHKPGSTTAQSPQSSTDWPQQPGSTTAQSPQSSTDWPHKPGSTTAQSPQSSTDWPQQPGSTTGQSSTNWPQQPGSTTGQPSTDWPQHRRPDHPALHRTALPLQSYTQPLAQSITEKQGPLHHQNFKTAIDSNSKFLEHRKLFPCHSLGKFWCPHTEKSSSTPLS